MCYGHTQNVLWLHKKCVMATQKMCYGHTQNVLQPHKKCVMATQKMLIFIWSIEMFAEAASINVVFKHSKFSKLLKTDHPVNDQPKERPPLFTTTFLWFSRAVLEWFNCLQVSRNIRRWLSMKKRQLVKQHIRGGAAPLLFSRRLHLFSFLGHMTA